MTLKKLTGIVLAASLAFASSSALACIPTVEKTSIYGINVFRVPPLGLDLPLDLEAFESAKVKLRLSTAMVSSADQVKISYHGEWLELAARGLERNIEVVDTNGDEPGVSTLQFEVLYPGNYKVKVTNDNGIVYTIRIPVTIAPTPRGC